MQTVLGTSGGLARLDADGHIDWLLKGDVSRIAGGWAVVDRTTLVAIDDPQTVINLPYAPQCLASIGEGVLVGTAESHLYAIRPGAAIATLIDSFDRIPTRDQWYTPWGGPPDTRSIAVTVDDTPLVNVHVGGVWRGDGHKWSEVIAVDDDTHQILASTDDDGTVVVAAAVGFGESRDGGRTFSWTTDGLHDTYCRAVTFAEDNVLVTASTGPFTKYGAVYVRPLDSTGRFIRCDNGLPEWFEFNIDTFQLAANGPDVVMGTEDGRIFVSDDAGASWQLLVDGLDAVRAIAFA